MKTLNGYEVVSSPSIPEFKLVNGDERKWAHRVMYQRNRRFKTKRVRMIICLGKTLHMHPNTYAELVRVSAANSNAIWSEPE